MPEITVDKLTSVYIKIREHRSKIKAAFEEEDSKLRSQQAKIKQALLDHCKENNVDSVKTGEGTFYRTVKTKYWTDDWQSMYKFIVENDCPEFLTKSLNQTNVKQYLEENPESVPPGLNVSSEYEIGVRKATK